MVDRYTKAILTVIAAALVALVVQQAVPDASAAVGSGCGLRSWESCYVTIVDR
ncbi:hypothetical protein [Inquilinus sp. OTU3971]|uniref:hypothetical protein n=1 Tax=Inquilinus sp. OTU3971 TaxID=3043855 RepID=UPI00313ED955